MNTRTDRTNRIVLTLLGLVLTVIGVYFLLRSAGVLFDRDAELVGPDLRDWANDNEVWLFVVAGLVFALLALLGLLWLTAQTRRWQYSSEDLTYAGDQPVSWRAVVSSDAVEDAVAGDIERHDSVEDVAAHLDLDSDPPRAELRVAAQRGTDLEALTAWIQREVLGPTSDALERPPLDARIHYRIVEAPDRVVR